MADINELLKYQQNKDMKVPKVLGTYVIDKLIIESHNGIVVSSVDPTTEKKVAIKCIPQQLFQLNPNIVNIMNTVNDQHIIKVLQSFHYPTPNPRFFAIVMPRELSDLLDYLQYYGNLPEKTVCSIMKQSLEAVKILHSNQIWHRDIKLEHILLTREMPPSIAISGFGLAKIIPTPTFTGGAVGTLPYAAPELLENHIGQLQFKTNATYSNNIDIWNLGVVMYALLSNCLPFGFGSSDDIEKHLNGQVSFDLHENGPNPFDVVSEEAKDLIRSMLIADPDKRITIDDALQHQFFNLHDDGNEFNQEVSQIQSALEAEYL